MNKVPLAAAYPTMQASSCMWNAQGDFTCPKQPSAATATATATAPPSKEQFIDSDKVMKELKEPITAISNFFRAKKPQ